MLDQTALQEARTRLAKAVTTAELPAPVPLDVSPWVAMSLLQKAIRRGREGLALRAAATLLTVSPERLWRRCGGIAFEDIGGAGLDTVSLVTAALAGKRFRSKLGGEWPVASFIISRMAQATKCRAADDLLLVAEMHPSFKDVRRQFASKPTSQLCDIVMGSAELPVRALAIWYAVGTERRPSPRLRPRRGDPQAVFDALCAAGFDRGVVEIAREGFRKLREALCPFMTLPSPERRRDPAIVEDDLFPPEAMVGEVPSWAYDMYSREGRGALQRFLQGGSETARWVRARVGPSRQVNLLGAIAFRAEGGLVRRRLRWPTADSLRRLVDIECCGQGCPDATEVLRLMRADIGPLNDVRRHVC